MIVVTGATGQLGSMIVDNLLAEVDAGQIAALARSQEKAAGLAEQDVSVHIGDYEDPVSLVAAFQDADVLMFISNTDFARRAEQHGNVVDAARKAGVGRIVYTSIVAADPDNSLVASHLQTEQKIKESGVPYTFLRNNFYMDMYVGEVENAIEQGVYRSPSREGGAAFVSRADIARMATAVLIGEGHAGKTYDLTGPSVVTPPDFAEVASAISGNSIEYQRISWDEMAEDYKKRGMPEEAVQMSIMVQRILESGILAEVSDDIGDVTGVPATSFRNFVKAQLA